MLCMNVCTEYVSMYVLYWLETFTFEEEHAVKHKKGMISSSGQPPCMPEPTPAEVPKSLNRSEVFDPII